MYYQRGDKDLEMASMKRSLIQSRKSTGTRRKKRTTTKKQRKSRKKKASCTNLRITSTLLHKIKKNNNKFVF